MACPELVAVISAFERLASRRMCLDNARPSQHQPHCATRRVHLAAPSAAAAHEAVAAALAATSLSVVEANAVDVAAHCFHGAVAEAGGWDAVFATGVPHIVVLHDVHLLFHRAADAPRPVPGGPSGCGVSGAAGEGGGQRLLSQLCGWLLDAPLNTAVVATSVGPMHPLLHHSLFDAHVAARCRPAAAAPRGPWAATAAATRWSDVVGLRPQKLRLRRAVLAPAPTNGPAAGAGGGGPGRGVLLFGAPGTGKTLLVRALVTELGAALLAVDAAALVRAEVGESERALRECFAEARRRAPCVVFLDEAQAAFGSRGPAFRSDGADAAGVLGGGPRGAGRPAHEARLVAALASELDACRGGPSAVSVVAATNRPDLLDPGLLTRGRLGVHVRVPCPAPAELRRLLRRVLRRDWGWRGDSGRGATVGHLVAAAWAARLPLLRCLTAADLRGALNVAGLRLAALAGADIAAVVNGPPPPGARQLVLDLAARTRPSATPEQAQLVDRWRP